ncbi:hypothetical protein SJAV_21390 [Sulfurisphaera javensis]|uniref:DUF4230 domain-containing protein n=1 Tax=Sulfurisphaera javensis TaxID=2049879 RepID=A0AAT9GTR6_9CREN
MSDATTISRYLIKKEIIESTPTKLTLYVNQGENALVISQGQILANLPPGKHEIKIANPVKVLKSKLLHENSRIFIYYYSTEEHEITLKVENYDSEIKVKVRVSDPEKLILNMPALEREYTINELKEELESDVKKVVEEILVKGEAEKIKEEITSIIIEKLRNLGLDLVNIVF